MLYIYIIGGLIAIVLLWFVFIYNRLVTLDNRAEEAWSDIDAQLQRRHTLIPNLVETVKGYASHEKEVFENVTKARAEAMQAEESGDPQKMGEAENMLTDTLKSLFAVAENYPDLKASDNFIELQRELRDTEDKILAARRFYNTTVRDMQTMMESFPANMVVPLFSFTKPQYFEIDELENREAPEVTF